MDTMTHARELLEHNCYAVVASADADGVPWATPVWFAADGLKRILWVSWPGSRHSELIAARADVALTVFDSHSQPGAAAGFYARARAVECPGDELGGAIAVFDERSRGQGLGGFGRADVTGEARLRMYVAWLSEAWVLDQESVHDQRARVPLVAPSG